MSRSANAQTVDHSGGFANSSDLNVAQTANNGITWNVVNPNYLQMTDMQDPANSWPCEASTVFTNKQVDIAQHPQQFFTAFPPIGAQVGHFRVNVDGFLVLSNVQADGKTHRAYVQIFRNGIDEAVDSSFLMGDGTAQSPLRLTSLRTEATIVKSSHTYLQALEARGAVPPYVVLVSLVGVKGISYSFAMGDGTFFEDMSGILDRDQFHFSEMVIEEVPFDRYEYARLIRPLLDQTANAAGRATSPSFDQNGRFRLSV